MDYTVLEYDKTGGVATVTLNRPEKSNAFDEALITELIAVLSSIERDREVRAVIITGAGKNFCAGQDLGSVLDRYKLPEGMSFGAHLRRSYNIIIAKIRSLEKPVIAAVNGAAAGAGFGLVCACDLRHASETAKFRMAFAGIALAPDSATSFLLPRLIGLGRAYEMAITNELIDAAKALEYGLVNRVMPPDELMPRTREFAALLAQAPTKSLGLTKRAFNYGLNATLEGALENEALLQEIAGHTQDHWEGVQAFVGKRSPRFIGK